VMCDVCKAQYPLCQTDRRHKAEVFFWINAYLPSKEDAIMSTEWIHVRAPLTDERGVFCDEIELSIANRRPYETRLQGFWRRRVIKKRIRKNRRQFRKETKIKLGKRAVV